MPRQKGPKLTMKKKARTQVRGADPDAPTDKEWARMKKYGSFGITDDDNEDHLFKTNDTALIMPDYAVMSNQLELHEFWVAKIKEIRARSKEDVWARVQWYWSGNDVAGLIKSFEASNCGSYERIFSDQYDYVSSQSFNGIVNVYDYFEHELAQADIGEDEFYCRYTLEVKGRKFDPKPIGTCICAIPYNPDDISEESIMHFCPRPNCRKAYHRSCLVKASYIDTNPSADLPIRLLASSPDSDDSFEFPSYEPPRKKQKQIIRRGSENMHTSTTTTNTSKTNRVTLPSASPEPEELLSALPADLVKVAEQPIIKGGNAGIVGNVTYVVNARRLVYEALTEGRMPADWVDIVDVAKGVVKTAGGKIPALLCPDCQGPI